MSLPVTINKLSVQMGLTSRTLRHWESEGLFSSSRDQISGWRVYDNDACLCISIASMLRKLDIPLRDIKVILTDRTIERVEEIIKKQLKLLERRSVELKVSKNRLHVLLDTISNFRIQQVTANSLILLENFIQSVTEQTKNEEMEDIKISMNEFDNLSVRFITLPPMRTVYNIAIGTSPEDEALDPVIKWLELEKLMGTARIFGGNVEPFPSKTNPVYGFGICASIPEGIEIPSHLKEMRLSGGLFAIMPSSEDIYGSWQALMKYLSKSEEYVPDKSRLCLEEHIRNDNPDGQGNQFTLNLLAPVKKK